MPCERKHIEAIKKAWVMFMYKHDHHNPVPWKWERILDNSIDAALSACDESPWRSMESAPKGGKYILICHGGWVPDIAGWRDERPARPGVMVAPPGWFTVAGPRSRILEPTHWMPLPAAPEVV